MNDVILVPGTHSWRGDESRDWYSPGSPFMKYLTGLGIALVNAERPFVWSTDLGGLGFGAGDLSVWKAAGLNLYAYVVPPRCPDQRLPAAETTIISHSHGLQVVLCACAEGLKVDTFIDVAGPVRQDMMPLAEAARPNIRRWIHVHAGHRDKWQWFGTFGDGFFGIVRQHPLADENVPVLKADHGDVLRNPIYFPIIGSCLQVTEW